MSKNEKKILITLIVLMIVAVCIAFSTIFYEAFVVPKRMFLRIFTTLALIFQIFLWFKYGFKTLKDSTVYAAASYVVIVLLSWVFSIHPPSGTDFTIDLLCNFIIFLIIFNSFKKEETEKILPFLYTAGILICLYSLYQHTGLDSPIWAETQQNLIKNRSISTLGNPNFLSALLTMLIPLALIKIYSEKKTENLAVYFLLLGLLIFTNIYTYSRAGFLAMIFGIILFLIIAGKKLFLQNSRKIAVILIITLLSIGGISYIDKINSQNTSDVTLQNRVTEISDIQENNLSIRVYLWKSAWLIFKESPLLGKGPDTFNITYLPYKYMEPQSFRNRLSVPGSSHNLFLDIAMFSGIFALAAFLIFTLIIIYNGAKFFRNPKTDEKDKIVAAGYFGGLGAFYVNHLAGFPTTPTDLLFWIFAGICCIYFLKPQRSEEKSTSTKPPLPPWKIALLGLACLLGVAAIYESVKTAEADYYFSRAMILKTYIEQNSSPEERLSLFPAATENFKKSIQLSHGKNPLYWRNFGALYEEFSRTCKDRELTLKIINQAIFFYETAIKLNPYDPYYYADMARILSNWHQMKQAEFYGRKSVEMDPYNSTLNLDFARTLAAAGKTEEAEKYYLKVIGLIPQDWRAYADMGVFYLSLGKIDQGEEYFKTAHKLNPKNEKIIDTLNEIAKIKANKSKNKETK